MKKLLIALLVLAVSGTGLFALELQRPRNAAACIMFPMVSSTTAMNVAGEAGNFTVKYATWNVADNVPGAFMTYTSSSAVELGTGVYYLYLSPAVMNNDYIQLLVTDTKCLDQNIGINTYMTNSIPANVWAVADKQVTVSSFTADAQADITEALSGQGYTTARAGYMDKLNIPGNIVSDSTWTLTRAGYLDAAVSSRSTLAAADVWNLNVSGYPFGNTAGGYLVQGATRAISGTGATAQEVWEYGARTITGTVTVSSMTAAAQADISEILDAQGWTQSRAGYVDKLNFTGNISTITPAEVWSFGTRALTDKAGFALTQSFPGNFSALSITAGGAVTVGTNSDKTGYALTQAFPANFSALNINALGEVYVSSFTSTRIAYIDKLNIAGNLVSDSTWTLTRAGYLDAAVSSRSTLAAADVWDYNVSAYTLGTSAGGYQVNASTRAISLTLTQSDYDAIASGVLDATALDYNTAGTIGNKINSAASAGDPWSTEISTTAYPVAGSAGRKMHEAWRERLRR